MTSQASTSGFTVSYSLSLTAGLDETWQFISEHASDLWSPARRVRAYNIGAIEKYSDSIRSETSEGHGSRILTIVSGSPSTIQVEITHSLSQHRERGGDVSLTYAISDSYSGAQLNSYLAKEFGTSSRPEQIAKVRDALKDICDLTQKQAASGSQAAAPRECRGRPHAWHA